MKIRRIRIWLSRGWYRVVYSVSFLVLSLLCSCSSSRTAAKEKTEGSKGVETSKDKEPVDSTKTDVSLIRMEEFQGLGIETPEIRLMYGVQPPADKENSYPLIVLNGKIINVDKEKLDAFDFEKDVNSKEKVAALLDVDEKTIFASCLMTDPSSITIWGTRGRNGVFEVVDKKRYRRYKSYNDYQPLK